MGCLFGQQRPDAVKKYAMVDYDRFHLLQDVTTLEQFELFFKINVITYVYYVYYIGHLYRNTWYWQCTNGDITKYLCNKCQYTVDNINTNESVLSQLFPLTHQNIQLAFANLPRTVFYDIITNEEAFLLKNMLQKEDINKDDYSCYDESQEDIQDNEELDNNNQEQSLSLSISSLKQQQHEPQQQHPDFGFKINHQYLVTEFTKYICPQETLTQQQFTTIFNKYQLNQVFKNALLFPIWFQDIHCDKFMWEKIGAGLIQRKFVIILNQMLIVMDNQNQIIITMIHLQLAHMQILKPNNINKFGISITLKETYEYYFDTQEELNYVYLNHSVSSLLQQYNCNGDINGLKECINEKLGQKMTLQKLKYTPELAHAITIHKSVSEFKGITKIHDCFIQNMEFIYLVTDYVPMTLQQYIDKQYQITEYNLRDVVHQLLTILRYLHFMGIVVAVIQPSQISVHLDRNGEHLIDYIQIYDMVYAQYMIQTKPIKLNANIIAAPEVQSGQPITTNVDNFIVEHLITVMIKQQSNNLKDFMKQLKSKITIDQALKHPWFSDTTLRREELILNIG